MARAVRRPAAPRRPARPVPHRSLAAATEGLGALAAYAEAHTAAPSAGLAALARDTLATAERPIMLSGTTVGRFLAILSATIRPALAVDVGTFTGYSALCLAEGLAPGGRVITCEVDPDAAARARRAFARSPYRDRIELRLGPAIATLRAITAPIDLAFIDADKAGYWDYYDAIIDRLAPTGLIVVDNTLMLGLVTVPDRAARALPPMLATQRAAIRAFNDRLQADPRSEHCLLTVRDGITVIRRRAARRPRRR